MTQRQTILTETDLRFQPCGIGRFFGAAFLGVWLIGWAAGELFVGYVLATGAYALVIHQPPPGWTQPLALGPALGVGAFLIVWFTFWTFGGLMALRELLRAFWAEDRLALGVDQLTVSHRLGPITRMRRLPRASLRRVVIQPRHRILVAETDAGVVELTRLGTVEARHQAAAALSTALDLPADESASVPERIPEGWQEVLTLRGGAVVVANPKRRRQSAGVVTGLAGVATVVVLLLIGESLRAPTLWGLTAMLTAGTLALIGSAVWLWQGRHEWAIGPGKLIVQRRFGARVTPLGEVTALELAERSDSDGDRCYALVGVGSTAAILSLRATATAGPRRFKLTQSLHDPSGPRRLGLWLSRRAGVPFADQVPDEAARRAQRERLMETLERSGKLGGFVARWVRGHGFATAPRNHQVPPKAGEA